MLLLIPKLIVRYYRRARFPQLQLWKLRSKNGPLITRAYITIFSFFFLVLKSNVLRPEYHTHLPCTKPHCSFRSVLWSWEAYKLYKATIAITAYSKAISNHVTNGKDANKKLSPPYEVDTLSIRVVQMLSQRTLNHGLRINKCNRPAYSASYSTRSVMKRIDEQRFNYSPTSIGK